MVEPEDLIAVDEYAHNSIVEGTKVAQANGVRVVSFGHNDAAALQRVLLESMPYRTAIVAVDGVYSMSGALAALPELDQVAREHNAVLYVDDAQRPVCWGGRDGGVSWTHSERTTMLSSSAAFLRRARCLGRISRAVSKCSEY